MQENSEIVDQEGTGFLELETRREKSIALDTLEAVESSINGCTAEYFVDEDANRLHFNLTMPEPQVQTEESTLADEIIAEYNRGHEENGWTWRSPASLASNLVHATEDEIREILENSDLFTISSNGRKFQLATLVE
jgi:hypothetical protein